MCLAAIAWQAHPHFHWVIAANRDEFYARPSAPAHEWADLPGAYGGRDLENHGSWLAADLRARIALVTNVRRPTAESGLSRGELVMQSMRSPLTTPELAYAITSDARRYRPFNLLIADRVNLHVVHGPTQHCQSLAPGVHGISNGDLHPTWPKTARLTAALARWCAHAQTTPEPLFAALANTDLAADDSLPDTGVGIEAERFLSSAFLRSERYGTRACSILMLDRTGQIQFIERSFGPHGEPTGERRLRWQSTP